MINTLEVNRINQLSNDPSTGISPQGDLVQKRRLIINEETNLDSDVYSPQIH